MAFDLGLGKPRKSSPASATKVRRLREDAEDGEHCRKMLMSVAKLSLTMARRLQVLDAMDLTILNIKVSDNKPIADHMLSSGKAYAQAAQGVARHQREATTGWPHVHLFNTVLAKVKCVSTKRGIVALQNS